MNNHNGDNIHSHFTTVRPTTDMEYERETRVLVTLTERVAEQLRKGNCIVGVLTPDGIGFSKSASHTFERQDCKPVPIQDNSRTLALKDGKTKYNALPCNKCGTTERFVSSDRCVKCSKEWSIKNSPKRPRGATFESKPCAKCGSTLRYVSHGACPKCAKTRYLRAELAKAQEVNCILKQGQPERRGPQTGSEASYVDLMPA